MCNRSAMLVLMTIDPLANYPGYLLRRVSVVSMSELAQRLKALQLRPAEALTPHH